MLFHKRPGILVNRYVLKRNQRKTLLWTDVHASATENAFSAIDFVAVEDGVDPAMQATARFRHGGVLSEAYLNLGHSCAALQRKHGNGLTNQLHEILRHGMPQINAHFDYRIGNGGTAQILIDANGNSFAITNAVDNETRTEDAVSSREHAWSAGHQGSRVGDNEAAGRDLNTIRWREELQGRGLSDRKYHGVARE